MERLVFRLLGSWFTLLSHLSHRTPLSVTDSFQLCTLNAVPSRCSTPLQYSRSPRGLSSCSLVVLTLGSPGSVTPLHISHSFLIMEEILFLLLFYGTFLW